MDLMMDRDESCFLDSSFENLSKTNKKNVEDSSNIVENEKSRIILNRGIVGKKPKSYGRRKLEISEAIQDYRRSMN